MFTVSNKSLIGLSVAAISLLSSCVNSKENKARECLDSAQRQFESEQYDSALATLDTLDARFASEVSVRREGLRLRPRIIEQMSLRSLEDIDRQLAELVIESEKYKESLKYVPDAFEGYYTTAELAGKVPAEKTGLYARMTSDGLFTVVASSTKSALSESVSLSTSGASVSTPAVPYDGERNDRSRGVEIINFMPGECDTLGTFAQAHLGEPVTLTFNGAKTYSIPLPADQLRALAKVHAASKVFSALRRTQNEKNRLEKQLQIARSQQARTFEESTDKK
ncbi:MAG: hypothetical protein K2H84_01280 [Paramuribaculum sp.]|nr:hypothetical protein [Paramuribaculum sp.]